MENFPMKRRAGLVEPGKNQLEGSSSDWHTIQKFARVSNDAYQILMETKDAPLVSFWCH